MTDNVMITISGLQQDLGSDGLTEVVSPGRYYLRDGRHYLCYDDYDENGVAAANVIRLEENCAYIIKYGEEGNSLPFRAGESTIASIGAGGGNVLSMDINTHSVKTEVAEDLLTTEIRYSLSMNDVFISDFTVVIKAESRPEQL